jgi:hypothetical protein
VELAHALVELAHRPRQQHALRDVAGHDAGDARDVGEPARRRGCRLRG